VKTNRVEAKRLPTRQTRDFRCNRIDTPMSRVGVQIEYDVVHLRTSLVQLFIPLQLNFEQVVEIIKLRRFGGAPNGYPFMKHLRAHRARRFCCMATGVESLGTTTLLPSSMTEAQPHDRWTREVVEIGAQQAKVDDVA
jgi:hypothetical protein